MKKITETIAEVIKKIHEQHADEEVYRILNNISLEMTNQEIPFRDDTEVELYLDRLRNTLQNGNVNINLYPSENSPPSSCKRICIGIASKGFDEKRYNLKTGFKGLMLNLCAYWFGCLSTNQTTLIFTKDWDKKKFKNYYKDIIDNYVNGHNKKVFIVEIEPAGFFLRYPF